MPSRKQRRRRAKDRRHDYEYVYVDGEGRELDEEDAEHEPTAAPPRARAGATARRSNGRASKARGGTSTQRKVDPPSWTRALKRSLIFAPFMFLTLYLLDRRLSLASRALVTAEMLIFFVPFTYLVDRTMYRRLNRPAGEPAPKTRRRAAKS